MTRKRYIKKFRYLRWRLSQLPCNENLHYRDTYFAKEYSDAFLSWDVLMMKCGQKQQRLLEPSKEWRTSNETLD